MCETTTDKKKSAVVAESSRMNGQDKVHKNSQHQSGPISCFGRSMWHCFVHDEMSAYLMGWFALCRSSVTREAKRVLMAAIMQEEDGGGGG